MGISIREFEVAMEVYGARRLSDERGSRYNILVPCFEVEGTVLLHSGSYYIVQRNFVASSDIMEKAISECDEIYPGGHNFWYGEIHSIKALFILVSMLEDRYSKEKVRDLINATYKKLFNSKFLTNNANEKIKIFDYSFLTSKKAALMSRLCAVINEFDNIANPLSKAEDFAREPVEYLNRVRVKISESNPTFVSSLSNGSTTLVYRVTDSDHQQHSIEVDNEDSWITLSHYSNENDEIIHLSHRWAHDYDYQDIDWNFSMKSTLIWTTIEPEKTKLATLNELKKIMEYLEMAISKGKIEVLVHMF